MRIKRLLGLIITFLWYSMVGGGWMEQDDENRGYRYFSIPNYI